MTEEENSITHKPSHRRITSERQLGDRFQHGGYSRRRKEPGKNL